MIDQPNTDRPETFEEFLDKMLEPEVHIYSSAREISRAVNMRFVKPTEFDEGEG